MDNRTVVSIETSARHVHLTQKVVGKLFGEGVALTKLKDLSQPGTFASEQVVTIKTENSAISNVRVLGPCRDYNQVEISRSDAYRLGLEPPVRDSHELDGEGTPGLTLVGLKGEVDLEKGVIIPWRHLHVSSNQAIELGLHDGQLVKIDIDNQPRSLIFENVLVRVSSKYRLAMHIDTDEANAAGIEGKGEGILLS